MLVRSNVNTVEVDRVFWPELDSFLDVGGEVPEGERCRLCIGEHPQSPGGDTGAVGRRKTS